MILVPTWKYLQDLIERREFLCCHFTDLQILLILSPLNMELLGFLLLSGHSLTTVLVMSYSYFNVPFS